MDEATSVALPPQIDAGWSKAYRLVASIYPPINLFERYADNDEFELACAIESLTNSRLRNELGHIDLVPPEDRLFGPGASLVMASFCHYSVNCPSRFTDGHFGVYYAAGKISTAIKETIYHRERFLADSQTPACDVTMRSYVGELALPMIDVRTGHDALHHPDNYGPAQAFARRARQAGQNGVLYRSVRDPDGECVAAFRPKAVTIPKQGAHYIYRWDGTRVYDVNRISSNLLLV